MPTEQLTISAAVFSGDPAGKDCNDNPQACNRHGTTFSFCRRRAVDGRNAIRDQSGQKSDRPAGRLQVGGWYATADFADQHFGLDGAGAVVSLADPAVAGPLNHRGNWGIYGVADQMVWRGGSEQPQSVRARRRVRRPTAI